MKRILIATLAAALAMVATPAAASAPGAERAPSDEALEAYRARVAPGVAGQFRDEGLDVTAVERTSDGLAEVELVLSPAERDQLAARGVELVPTTAQTRTLQAPEVQTDGVYRSYSEPGGIADELRQLADERPDIVKLVSIGQSVQGQEILAAKVTADATTVADGSRPASAYVATQHAREWITVEIARRLLHDFVDGYGADDEMTDLIDRNEFWFVPVANPDGYDYTFTEGNRLWRKNLADNDGDGQITPGDGVDPNRNFPFKWGYDNEGSSPNPANQTYRGPSPGSEPETQALDDLFERIGFRFFVNYHSAAELNLYGTGWQVATPSPDDAVYQVLTGSDENPSIPGYDPDPSSELYTTNGETTNHMHEVHGTLGFTPENTTCQTASNWDPDDEWEAADCQSVFNFPDDEELIAREYEQNVEFALDVARSTTDPDDPVSYLGFEAPDFQVDTFDVSHGDRQMVEVNAKRSLRGRVLMHYEVNGRRRVAHTVEWEGGSRYGGENDVYYAPLRGEVVGARPGDTVEVWFRAGRAESERFTYTVADYVGGDVLVLANEAYTGLNPVQDVDAPRYLDAYTASLDANGISHDVWDVDASGPPHPLGVLSHYDAVVWYTGDQRINQEESDVQVGGLRDVGVAEDQQFTTIAVRDYLNEDGKLFHTGEYAGYFGPFGVLFFGGEDDPEATCAPTSSFFSDCLLYSDDFHQYWLGAFQRGPADTPVGVVGVDDPFDQGFAVNGGDGADNAEEPGRFQPTSDVLPAEEFPLFASWKSLEYDGGGPDPYAPIEGEWYAASEHGDTTYNRLARQIDLAGATSGVLAFQFSYDTESTYDYAIVEARVAGSDDWTTLPEVGGLSTTDTGASCAEGLWEGLHPQLDAYLTYDGTTGTCAPTGTTGEWHGFTGNSGGWQEVAFDLSGYAGETVEVAVSYVTDPASGGVGAFVDDVVVTVDGREEREGFEEGLGAWTVPGPPEGSPGNSSDWVRAEALAAPQDAAAVSTDDTVYMGFGFEAIATQAARDRVMGEVMDYLLE